MADATQLNLKLNRSPLPDGLDPHDLGALDELFLVQLERGLTVAGGVPSLVHCVRDDRFETSSLDGLGGDDPDAMRALVLLTLVARPTVIVAYRQGEVLHSADGGPMRRHAVQLEWHADGAWRLAMRPFGVTDQGLGQAYGSWERSEGSGWEALPEGLQPWVYAAHHEVQGFVEKNSDTTVGEVEAMMIDLVRQPVDAGEAAAAALEVVVPDVLQLRTFDRVRIVTFKQGSMTVWRLPPQPPFPLEGGMRALAQLHGRSQAVALVHPGAANLPDGTQVRAAIGVAEMAGARATVVVPLLIEGDKLVARPPLLANRADVAEGASWLEGDPGLEMNTWLADTAAGEA